ncbi:MAG: cystathione beta-lyase, partial [Erysipelotrichaceae bacterium]
PQADVTPFWVADMDFECPRPIIDALNKRVDHGIFGYTMVSDRFRQSVSSWMLNRHQSQVDMSWVEFSPGVLKGITNAILALSEVQDQVIIQTPVYYPFRTIVENVTRVIVENPLIEKDGAYMIDFNDLERKASDPKTKLMILCHPHNPLARVFTQEELIQISEICLRHDVVILSDEIHQDIVYPPYKHISVMHLEDRFTNNALCFISPSKTFNLAGLQTSAVIIKDPLKHEAYNLAAQKTHTNMINVFGETALCAAYDHCGKDVDELIVYLQSNIDYVRHQLQTRFPQLQLFEPQGTYLLWIDFRQSGVLAKDLPDFMSHKVKIAVDDGSWFGKSGEGFIRLNIACPQSMLKEAFDRLENAFKSLK